MSLTNYSESPWRGSHPAYENRAFFKQEPAPENATGEVLLSSVYRACGYTGVSEGDVAQQGREFATRTRQERAHAAYKSSVGIEEWQAVMGAILESPKQPNQSSKRFLQMTPLVPPVALYSGAVRLSGSNPWNPGALVKRMIVLGCDSYIQAEALWARLGEALSVSAQDDIWARWLKSEFNLRKEDNPDWALEKLESSNTPDIPLHDKLCLRYPARQFCRDLGVIISVKAKLTRRQWISMLESLLRLAGVAHVVWVNDVHDRLWKAIKATLSGEVPTSTEQLQNEVFSCTESFLRYGSPAAQSLRTYASRYLVARVGINCTLWALEDAGISIAKLGSCDEVYQFLLKIYESREKLRNSQLVNTANKIVDDHARLIDCKKGIGSNLMEFCNYMLAQRQTVNQTLRGYDQGYFLHKKGTYRAAPFVVAMGPVAILTIVQCCLRDASTPRSVHALTQHLAKYGIDLSLSEITSGDLGAHMRTLGLVLDSPDAESGMLLVPPFK